MLNIVLFEPQIPQNTGNVARSCAVTGTRLHLIGPLGFALEDKKMKRAGLTYWEILDVHYYKDFQDFWSKHHQDTIYSLSRKAEQAYTEITFKDEDYLLFGREDTGVSDEVSKCLADKAFRIPMRGIEGARCLNLATSVGIVLYEALRQLDFLDLS